jgi:hypothetical protein
MITAMIMAIMRPDRAQLKVPAGSDHGGHPAGSPPAGVATRRRSG